MMLSQDPDIDSGASPEYLSWHKNHKMRLMQGNYTDLDPVAGAKKKNTGLGARS